MLYRSKAATPSPKAATFEPPFKTAAFVCWGEPAEDELRAPVVEADAEAEGGEVLPDERVALQIFVN